MKIFSYQPTQLEISLKEKRYLWSMEALWWLFSIILTITVIYPVFTNVENYPFTLINIAFILLFFHYARHVVLLNYCILKTSFWLKALFALISPALLFYMAGKFGYFQTFMDEHTMSEVMPGLSYDKQLSLNNYIKSQMIFFATGTIISGILFVFRMILSLWRQTNQKGI